MQSRLINLKKANLRDFLGSPLVRTPHFHCQGCGFLVRKLRCHKPCRPPQKSKLKFILNPAASYIKHHNLVVKIQTLGQAPVSPFPSYMTLADLDKLFSPRFHHRMKIISTDLRELF